MPKSFEREEQQETEQLQHELDHRGRCVAFGLAVVTKSSVFSKGRSLGGVTVVKLIVIDCEVICCCVWFVFQG